jgi:hypothetical protein
MTDREVMQQALEALEISAVTVDSFRVQKATQEAITALKAALEQPDQGPVACVIDGDLYFHHEIDWEDLAYQGHEVELLYTTPPAAQPTTEDSSAVAAPVQSGLDADCIASVVSQRYTTPPAAQPEQEPVGEVLNERGEIDYISYVPPVGTRLYTTPPAAQRKPLTDEEIGKAWSVADGEHNASASVKRRITGAIEAKLKERNNG